MSILYNSFLQMTQVPLKMSYVLHDKRDIDSQKQFNTYDISSIILLSTLGKRDIDFLQQFTANDINFIIVLST